MYTRLTQDSGVVLEKVCEYLYYNEKNKGAKEVPDMDIPAELCLEILMAADYLNGLAFLHCLMR
jgi:transcription elongation factor B subunit 1